MAGFLKGKFQIVWPLDFNMVGCKMGCLQLIMAVSIHIGYLGNYYSLHPDLRCTTQNIIAGAYYNSGQRVSVYAGRKVAMGDGFLEIGLSSGYGDEAIPMLRYRKGNIFVVPAYQDSKKEKVYGLLIGWQF